MIFFLARLGNEPRRLRYFLRLSEQPRKMGIGLNKKPHLYNLFFGGLLMYDGFKYFLAPQAIFGALTPLKRAENTIS